MSQPNRPFPSFIYSVQEAPNQYTSSNQVSHQSNNSSQQWNSSGPQSVQLNMPSPSTSVRSAVTAPVQRSFDRSNFNQANISPVDIPIDPSLYDLSNMLAPPGHVSRSNYNPIARSIHDEGWNPYHLRNGSNSDVRTPPNQINASFKTYHSGPGSIGSTAPISDSGYHTQSVMSNDPSRVEQSSLPSGLTLQAGNMNVRSTPSETPRMVQIHSDQRSQISSRSGQSKNQDKKLRCPKCSEILKCNSDYKKHKLKHDKPFMCNVPGCKRNGQGFTTINDLDRHKKSVHRIGLLLKSYQCASETCRNKEKVWPRLDNFKQHIERMHKEEDHIDLIKRSAFLPKRPFTIQESVAVAPMEIMIVGMEKSFSGHSNYEPATGSNMVADQDISHWPTNLNPADIPMNFHQTVTSIPGPGSRNDIVWRQRLQGQPALQNQQRMESMQQQSHTMPTKTSQNVRLGRNPREQQRKKTQPQLSNAPQTKSQQQQRHALQKRSLAVSDEADNSEAPLPIDLEQIVLSVLAQTNNAGGEDELPQHGRRSSDTGTQGDRANKIFLTKDDAIKAEQILSKLIKQTPGSAYSQSRRASQGLASNPKVCPLCGYAVVRTCDLKKHMKRHEKPYGCTYPKCHKRFGAKSDWKRHENSQHFQLEAYRCAKSNTRGEICGEHFFRVGLFYKHLETRHNMFSREQWEQEAGRRRIGKNCQQQFWCGFHQDIIKLNEERNAAWGERFDHIAYHFEKEKMSIEEWVCVEENKTKKELLKEMDRSVFDDEEKRGVDTVGEMDDGSPSNVSGNFPPPLINQVPTRSPQAVDQGITRKRQASAEISDPQKPKRQKHATPTGFVRFCCGCGVGPLGHVQAACTECNHQLCDRCRNEYTYPEVQY